MKRGIAIVFLVLLPAVGSAQKEKAVEVGNGKTTTIKIVTAPPSSPAATLTLNERHGHARPTRTCLAHTGGGNIDVSQPSPDTVVITMTGIVVAGCCLCDSVARFDFELEQCFEVVVDQPENKITKLSLEARMIGLLRSHCKGGGSAEESGACAAVVCGPREVLHVCAPPHSVAGGENLSINDHEGPVSVPVSPGKYTLHQTFHIGACHPRCLLPCKTASAEFAPDPALDPLWISYFEPFHGAQKKDFGFQITLKVAAEDKKEDKKDEKKEDKKDEKPEGNGKQAGQAKK